MACKPCILLLALCLCISAAPSRAAGRYNTNAKRLPDKLNIHLVCHTHDDSGWLKTFDQYYYGARQDIQMAGVQYILDSVMGSLRDNPDRKFVYAEMSFFTRWWAEQSDASRQLVRSLIENGQLGFVNGGYVQHDEAAAHYVAMIDQTTRGHRFLNNTFGVAPEVAWQIDPFGHSSTQASLMSALAGYKALFFGRADYQDMTLRAQNREFEMLWRASQSWGAASDIFTHNSPNGNYGPPLGFNWDWGQMDDPLIDDPDSPFNNVVAKLAWLSAQARNMFSIMRGNDIMFFMGSDFEYALADAWYKNLDKLIHYINEAGEFNIFYSTPAEYVAAKMSYDDSVTWPVKTDDFFPYADCPHCYWTGYFTSRPTSKGYIRAATAYLQAARQLQVLAKLDASAGSTDALEAAVALCQHHDSITGTEKQAVANDYARIIARGWDEAARVVNAALLRLLFPGDTADRDTSTVSDAATSSTRRLLAGLQPPKHRIGATAAESDAGDATNVSPTAAAATAPPALQLQQCLLLNASICEPTVHVDGTGFMVVAYNSLAWPRQQTLQIPVGNSDAQYRVEDADGKALKAQLAPISNATWLLQLAIVDANIAPETTTFGLNELTFEVTVPPLGYAVYYVRTGTSPVAAAADAAVELQERPISQDDSREAPSLSSSKIRLTYDATTGLLATIEARDGSWAHNVTLSFLWYAASVGAEAESQGQAGGAYIMRLPADNSGAHNASSNGAASLSIVEGPLVSEARQSFSDWAHLTTRLGADSDVLDMEWTVGPIPGGDNLGKEVVLRISTDLATGGVLYTDSNGREMLRRDRNLRPTWALEVHEPVAGNYYPMTAGAYITDGNDTLALATDRAQGVASIGDGQLEVLVHRRTVSDDARGVAENIDENMCGCRNCACRGLIARGSMRVTLQPAAVAAPVSRAMQQHLNDPMVLAFAALPGPPPTMDVTANPTALNSLRGRYSGLPEGTALPANVHLLTLMQLEPGKLLLRVAHMFQVGEDPELSKPASVNLTSLVPSKLVGIRELSLTANRYREQMAARHNWTDGGPLTHQQPQPQGPEHPTYNVWQHAGDKLPIVELFSMEIRTFEVRTA